MIPIAALAVFQAKFQTLTPLRPFDWVEEETMAFLSELAHTTVVRDLMCNRCRLDGPFTIQLLAMAIKACLTPPAQ